MCSSVLLSVWLLGYTSLTVISVLFLPQSGSTAPDVSVLRSRVTELEEEREEMLCKLDQYDDLIAKNGKISSKGSCCHTLLFT